ncbi:MAG TPA: DNA cytosine methyltransferase, partial [Acidimicrobiales bacterium]|nr:DNA cytosine methyltransferase [Acidimicrobiales bacterium]
MPAQLLTAVDLFAGAGGLSLGFLREGFDVVAAVEHDADAARSYRALHEHVSVGSGAKLHEQDICEV